MKIPARCNKRNCQGRRNLSKYPEKYVRHPRCHIPGCSGIMYVDTYRLRGGKKDRAPLCRDDCLPYPHRVDTKACKKYEAYQLERGSKPRSKHSPVKWEEHDAPF